MDLAARVAPLTMARDRALPVAAPLGALLPEPSLVRGRVVSCGGCAALSTALALVADATAAGSWLAVVGVPALGVDAAREAGVAVERLVAVDADPHRAAEWAERVAAAADGFDLVLAHPPARPGALLRRVQRRIQARGAVLVVLAGRAALGSASDAVDLVVDTSDAGWDGLGEGHGHLRRRRVLVSVTGRRSPRPVERELWLPGADGRVAAVDPVAPTVPLARGAAGDPHEQQALDRAG